MGKRTLLAGPWIGEFGYELCQWQGLVRREARKHDHVTVVTYPGHEGMYRDVTDDIRPLPKWFTDKKLDQNCFNIFHPKDQQEILFDLKSEINRIPHTHSMPGFREIATGDQDWGDWRLPDEPVQPHLIALVTRRRAFDDHRNWEDSRWLELQRQLEQEGFTVQEAPHDWNGSLQIFSACSLAVGGSTGGMHLASLCRCPHYVWGAMSFPFQAGYTLRERYETFWNPHNTPVVTHDTGWQPEVDDVTAMVRTAHQSIGRTNQCDY